MPADDSRSRSSSPYAVEQMAVKVDRSVFGAVWRWRTELGVFLLLAASFFYGWWRLGSWLWPLLVLVGLVLAVTLLPHPRRSFLLARFWVLFTRHRLQRSFWELRLHTRAGRLPLVPLVFSTPVGVRAWVVLRAGMTFADFQDSTDAFTVACGARDCRVTAWDRWAGLVFIDVIRRDVLGPNRVIRSPLADFSDYPAIDPFNVPALPEPELAED